MGSSSLRSLLCKASFAQHNNLRFSHVTAINFLIDKAFASLKTKTEHVVRGLAFSLSSSDLLPLPTGNTFTQSLGVHLGFLDANTNNQKHTFLPLPCLRKVCCTVCSVLHFAFRTEPYVLFPYQWIESLPFLSYSCTLLHSMGAS